MNTTDANTYFGSPFVNEATILETRRRVDEYDRCLGVGGGGLHFDTRRFAVTVEYMKEFGLHRGYCVEIGSLEYLSSRILWSFFPGAMVYGTYNDLRKDPLPFANNSVDNVICTEVIEHISDIAYQQATTLDGIFFFLDEVYRILRVGGRALITTPNAASLWALQQVLIGKAPLIYDWHFREFTKDEMQQIVEYAGFKIVAHNTEFVWHLWNFSPIQAFILQAGYELNNRGDDQFIVIEKTNERIRKPHKLMLPSTGREEVREEKGWRYFRNKLRRNLYRAKLYVTQKFRV